MMHLWPGEWREQLKVLNSVIDKENKERLKTREVANVTNNDWWLFIAIILVAPVAGVG